MKKSRVEYNRQIIQMLIAAVERYPDWRFGQILRNLEVVKEVEVLDKDDTPNIMWQNGFHEESGAVQERIGSYLETLKKLGVGPTSYIRKEDGTDIEVRVKVELKEKLRK